MSDESRETEPESPEETSSDAEQTPEDRVERDVDFVGTAEDRGGEDESGPELLGATDDAPQSEMPASSEGFWQQWQQRPQPAPSGPIDELEMSEPTFLTRGVVFPGIALLAGALFYGGQIWEYFTAPYMPIAFKVVMAVIPGIYLLYVLYRAYIYPRERQAVEFGEDGVVLPKSSNSKLEDKAPYDQIQAILAVARGPIQSVIVDYGDGTAMYSSKDFEREDAPALLRRELMRRIKQLPNSDEVLSRLEEQEQRSRDLSQRSNTATTAMLAVIGLVFAFQHFVGGLDGILGMVRWGAAAPPLIDDGQYFRLVAANLYHGGWLHLLLNGVALFFLGTVVEKITDKWTLIFVTLFSGVAGVATSWILTQPWPYSLGSSAAIFGLFGAFAVLHLKYRRDLPALYRQSKTWWIIIIGLNAGLSFGIDMVDEWAHMGGMVAGALAMWLALIPRGDFDHVDRPPQWVKALAGVMLAVFAAGAAWTAAYAINDRPDDRTRMFQALVEKAESGEMDPLDVNDTSFMVATQQELSREHLELLESAVEAAIEDNREPQIIDTLATIRYLLGKKTEDPDRKKELFRRAIEDQVGVLGESKSPRAAQIIQDTGPTFATQLARFLDAHRKAFGPWIRADASSTPSLEFDPTEDGSLTVAWEPEAQTPVRVLVVAKSDGEIDGLLQVCDDGERPSRTIESDDAFTLWPNNLRLYPAYVDEDTDQCDEDVEYWEAVQTVKDYP
ncbi:MAG: rhomboid family intramembrane serine protease [Myxococcota bacterium]